MRLNPSMAQELLAPLFFRDGGVIEHRWKSPSGGMQSRFYANVGGVLNAMSSWLTNADHYFGVATRKDRTSGKKDNLLNLVCLHADVDFGPDRIHRNRDGAREAIGSFPVKPSILVDTGGGFHVYWLLHNPLKTAGNLARVEAINRGVAQALGGDAAWDASRVLRIPGTFNMKKPHHPRMVRVIWANSRRYSLDDFGEYEKATPTPKDNGPIKPPKIISYGGVGGSPYGRKALANEVARLAGAREGSHYRNIQLNKAAYNLGRLVGSGELDRGIVEAQLLQVALNIGLPEQETLATPRSGLMAGTRKPRWI